MTENLEHLVALLERMNQRLQDLEQRVAALETHSTTQSAPKPKATFTTTARPKPPDTWRGFPEPGGSGGTVPVLGKAVLGIAGAYLLRAISESGSVPKVPVLLLAIVYAGIWMVWAARIRPRNGFASVTYAVTSALVLSPLLWESTVRFQILPPAFSGAMLVGYVMLALALSWRTEMQVIPWIAMLAAVNTSLALIIGTHHIATLTASMLAIALVTECAVCLGRELTMRAVPAVAADLAVLLLVDVMTSADGVPEGYPPASAAAIAALCVLLLVVYGASVAYRGFWLRREITFFEMGQTAIAFALATFGALRATHGGAAPALGGMFLFLAAACYWGALRRFAGDAFVRNRHVSASWAAALLLAGSLLLFPTGLQTAFLILAATTAAFFYRRTGKVSFGIHASLFLTTAALVSSLLRYIVDALAGSVPGMPPWGAGLVAISAAVCYYASHHNPEQGWRRTLWFIPASLVAFATAAFVVAAVVAFFGGHVDLAASRLSVIRTVVNCVLALLLAFLGSRWQRAELGWLAYGAVAFGTVKLLFEDLRFGNAASLVVSLLFYGLILILLPRFMQRGRTANAVTAQSEAQQQQPAEAEDRAGSVTQS